MSSINSVNGKSENGPPYSRMIPNTSTHHSGCIYRTHKTSLIGATALHGSTTLYESFVSSLEKFPNSPCLGERLLDSNMHTPTAGPFIFRTYSQIGQAVRNVASGLMKEMLIEPNPDNLRLLGIYMKNCASWTIAEYACYSQKAITVPLYDTLGPETVEFIVDQTQLQTILCSHAELSTLVELKAAGKCASLKNIILTAYGAESKLAQEPSNCSFKIYAFSELSRIGSSYPVDPHPPVASNLATFCYTSGTTGTPKGAMISHRNLVSVANSGLSSCFGDMSNRDYYLSFLPLPHIFERIVLSSLLACGSAIGYSRGNPLLIIEDCIALHPTIFCAVPRLLNRIFDKITAAAAGPGIKSLMLRTALREKMHNFHQCEEVSHTIWDMLVFSKIKSGLGLQHVRRLISGGAPLPTATMEFFRILIGGSGTVHEGYGQTESTGGTSITYEEDLTSTGHVGGPLPVVEIKLQDVPEMGYLHTDTLHNHNQRCDGRGEICVRGPGVFLGYYKDPAATAEAIDSEGWLHSGDIGLLTPFGQLAIIDRKKNLIKLSQGEYVAVEKIENILGRAALIAQVFVHGESTENYLVAVVVPDEEAVVAAGRLEKDVLHERIMEQIASLSKENGLHGYETVKAIFVEPPVAASMWSPENGLMTPTFKLKRQELKTRYASEIVSLYKGVVSRGTAIERSKL